MDQAETGFEEAPTPSTRRFLIVLAITAAAMIPAVVLD